MKNSVSDTGDCSYIEDAERSAKKRFCIIKESVRIAKCFRLNACSLYTKNKLNLVLILPQHYLSRTSLMYVKPRKKVMALFAERASAIPRRVATKTKFHYLTVQEPVHRTGCGNFFFIEFKVILVYDAKVKSFFTGKAAWDAPRPLNAPLRMHLHMQMHHVIHHMLPQKPEEFA